MKLTLLSYAYMLKLNVPCSRRRLFALSSSDLIITYEIQYFLSWYTHIRILAVRVLYAYLLTFFSKRKGSKARLGHL